MKKHLIYKEDVIEKAWLGDECEVVSLVDIEDMEPVAVVYGLLHTCPVCSGKGFLPGNFYEQAGASVSFSSYVSLSNSCICCRSCSGKGFIEIDKKNQG